MISGKNYRKNSKNSRKFGYSLINVNFTVVFFLKNSIHVRIMHYNCFSSTNFIVIRYSFTAYFNKYEITMDLDGSKLELLEIMVVMHCIVELKI